jgi:hypothetical protein
MADPKQPQQPAAPTTTAIQARDPQTGLVSFEPDSLDRAIELCERLSKSGLLPPTLVGKPNDVLVLTLTGRDLGLTFMQSLQSIQIIEGRPNLSAKLKVALVRRHPCCEYFRLVESTDKIAVWATKRRGNEPTMEKFTMAEAQAAGLVHKTKTGAPGMYEKWPKQMLRARAATQLCDREYQDVLLNLGDDIEFAAGEAAREVLTPEAVNAEFERVEPIPAKAKPVAKSEPQAEPAKPQAEDAEFTPVAASGDPCRRCQQPTTNRDEEGKPWCATCQGMAEVVAEGTRADVESPGAKLLAAIAAAPTEAALEAVMKQILALPEAERDPLRQPYKERKLVLRAEAANAAKK